MLSSNLLRQTYGERFLGDQKTTFLRANSTGRKSDSHLSRTLELFHLRVMRSSICSLQNCLRAQKFNSKKYSQKYFAHTQLDHHEVRK